jgi:alkylhydroperoxidase family enzyme
MATKPKQHFSEKEVVDLTIAVVAIKGWNRVSIATRAQPQVKSRRPPPGW